MSYKRKNLGNILVAIIGVIVTAAIAIWQFYLFATFTDSTGFVDMQGGIVHLCLALAAGLIACIASFFVFSHILQYDREDELHITSSALPSRPKE